MLKQSEIMVEITKNTSGQGTAFCGTPVLLDRGTLRSISAELYFRYLLTKGEAEKSDMLCNTIMKAFDMTNAARMRGGSYSLTRDEVKETVKSIDRQFASEWADKVIFLKFGSAAWTWSYLEFSTRAKALEDFVAMLRPVGIAFGKGELESATLVAELRKENIVPD
jgi:hypothetical protein